MGNQVFGQPAEADGQSGKTTQTPEANDSGNGQEPVTLTRQQLDELLSERDQRLEAQIKENTDKAFRGLQSSNQKLANEFEKGMALLRAAGVEPTPSQEIAIREQAMKQVQAEEAGNQQTPGQVQTPPTENRPAVNNLTAVANALIGEAGFSIDQKTDPKEYAMIDQKTTDPNAFLNSVRNAIAAKQTRLGKPTSTIANTPGVSGGGNQSPSLAKEYIDKKSNIRRGDHKALLELKMDYRQRGLDVDGLYK